ncbi:acyl-CoA dehydrogenase [Histoplasma capsulatum var. duboisii H88]|uniref:Acyl-CoA dehydrogenase n=1 Tax=Ajellomyces capsulatus (strain H88) TaxID=544711 RepID=A0A8A1LFX3_AJEC8|nr:acyl-CoA dehydrogenase [Histoplasma capsulatum var. duboisii H88]
MRCAAERKLINLLHRDKVIPGKCMRRPKCIHPFLSPRVGHRSLHARATEYLQPHDPDWTESQRIIRESIAKICSKFPDEYWLNAEESRRYPLDFQAALAKDGWLGICMPAEYGGSQLGISEAAVMMQTISESGAGMAGASSVHMNIFGLEPVVKFGNAEQKRRFLIPLVQGRERACFGVTEPNTGHDTLKLRSMATRNCEHYILKGSKIWISAAQHAEKILILVRTSPLDKVTKPSQGLSLFYTDLDRSQVDVSEIPKMGRAAVDSNTLFFENWKVPAADMIGEENNGFKMIIHDMNAERILIAAEALGARLRGDATRGKIRKRATGVRETDWANPGHSTSTR